jgi:hypothetical protein
LDIAAHAWDGNCEIRKQIQPKPKAWKNSSFVPETVAE